MIEVEFTVDPGHPAFAGHFPGQPILPGVVLLDEVMRVIEAAFAAEGTQAVAPLIDCYTLSLVKFHQPVGPGARLLIRLDPQPSGTIAFTVTQADRKIASGSFAAKGRTTLIDVPCR
ncbi:MAG: hypothetical protein ABJB17_04160 [Burkholderiales bacterium]